MAVSPNVHHVADLSAGARLISAFQNGTLSRFDRNLPGGASLEKHTGPAIKKGLTSLNFENGAGAGIRTPDFRFKRPLL